tara:strand:- start:1496 stop:2536 length:1041 start_codon:yes stop_codon:yes gene_type:complete
MNALLGFLSIVPFSIKIPLLGVGLPYIFLPCILKRLGYLLAFSLILIIVFYNGFFARDLSVFKNIFIWSLGVLFFGYIVINKAPIKRFLIIISTTSLILYLFGWVLDFPNTLAFDRETHEGVPIFLSVKGESTGDLILSATDPNMLVFVLTMIFLFNQHRGSLISVGCLFLMSILAQSTFFMGFSILLMVIFVSKRLSFQPWYKLILISILIFVVLLIPFYFGFQFNVRFFVWSAYFNEIFNNPAFFYNTALNAKLFASTNDFLNIDPHNTFIDMYVFGGVPLLLLYTYAIWRASLLVKLKVSRFVIFVVLIFSQFSLSLGHSPIVGFYIAAMVYTFKYSKGLYDN